MKRGDIYLAAVPFTDGSASKLRPVLVVSSDRSNLGADVVVMPISSTPSSTDPHSTFIDSASAEFGATGLKQSSAIKWSKPLTLCKTVIKRRLGKIAAPLLADAVQKLTSLVS